MHKRTTASKIEDFEEVPILQPLSEVKPKRVEWLWYPYLALGKLCFLDGREGLGKTWIALEIAAALTTGRPLPGQDEESATEPRSVIYMTLEDDLDDTIQERLTLQGADLSRFFHLDGYRQGEETIQFTLDKLNVLGNAIVQHQAALVVVDPFLAYLPKGHQHAEGARRIMTGLKQLARRWNCTILGLRHLTKDGKVRGSIEINAAARSMLLVGEIFGQRLVAHSKSNLAPKGTSWAYDFGAGRLEWAGESNHTAEDLLKKPKDKPRQREAGEFVEHFLARGPRAAAEVEHRAAAEGISRSTLNRTKEALGVRSFQRKRQWFWEKPQPTELSEPEAVSVVAEREGSPARDAAAASEHRSDEDCVFALAAGDARAEDA
jgi:AAA domain